MAFHSFCTGNDMRYSSESSNIQLSLDEKLKIKVPKPSYEILTKLQKNSPHYNKVEFKTKSNINFNKNYIPNFIDITLYSIKKSENQQLIALQIVNNSLSSRNPYVPEPNLILYCHENETDLFRIIPFLIDLSIQMKCDIISFDYFGFGCSSGKPKINTIISDGEKIINFILSFLKYKTENILLIGRGIGAICTIFLASRQDYRNIKGLILLEPIIGKNIIDQNAMKSIHCPTLLIQEVEDKSEINEDEIILFCREISDEKEWFPKKKKKNFNMNSSFAKISNQDIIFRHRSKFMLKLREYIYPDKEMFETKRRKSTSGCHSTNADSSSSEFKINVENKRMMSFYKSAANNKLLNFYDVNEKNLKNNKVKNNEEEKIRKASSVYEYDCNEEIEENNDEDY